MSALLDRPSRRYRDGVGSFDRYRVEGQLPQRPGELIEPLLAARTLSLGSRCLLWTPPITTPTAPGSGPDPELIESAHRVNGIDSRHFPRLLDQGYLPGMGLGASYPFLAWELQEGETLRRRLQSGPLEPSEAVEIAAALAEALEGLHRAGQRHGWLCPAVVYLCRDGRVQLLLAGVAAALAREEALPVSAYRAPEQLPEPWRPTSAAPGPASDLWCLGVLMHEAIDGAPPFDGESLEGLAEGIAAGRRRGLTRPPELTPILDALLRVDPEQRVTSAASLAAELRACRRQLPDPPAPRAAPESIARTRRSRPTPSEQELRGLLDLLRERREHMAREPGLPLWQLLLPPALLAAMILLVAWLFWQAT